MRGKRFALGAVCAGLFASCLAGCASREDIATGVDAQQSVAIFVALKNSGIVAERTAGGGGKSPLYSIRVSHADVPRALEVLHEYKLPRTAEDSFETLTGSDDLVPNIPAVSQLRLDRALALDIERALALFPGVTDVRVVVRSHFAAPTAQNGTGEGPSAAVFLRYIARSGNLPFSLEEVRKHVVEAIPGILPERVSVTPSRVVFGPGGGGETPVGREDGAGPVVPLVEVEPFSFLVPAQDRRRVLSVIAGYLLLFSLASGVVGYAIAVWFGRRRTPRGARMVKSATLEATYGPPARTGGSSSSIPAVKPAVPPKNQTRTG